jgi:DNA-binding MarR family transcriptional regulator
MREFSYSQIKIQLIELIEEDRCITKAAFELAIHLVMQHLYRANGNWALTDAQLAECMGWKSEKVSRAVKVLATSDLFEVSRGRWNRATEYAISELGWQRASERRLEHEKIHDLREVRTHVKSSRNTRKVLSKTPEKSGAYNRSKTKYPGAAESSVDDLVFVPSGGSCFEKQWNAMLAKAGRKQLSDMLEEVRVEGRIGFWLPALWPEHLESPEWAAQLNVLDALSIQTSEKRTG